MSTKRIRAGHVTPPATPTSRRRRRPPNWIEQSKREAWGKFWGQVNKGAMTR